MSKKTVSSDATQLARFGNWLLMTIVILLPFHAFITTWLGSQFGHFDLIRSWKEVLLLVACVVALAVVLRDRQQHWHQLLRRAPVLWIGGYVCLVMAIALFTLASGTVSREALLYGLMIQLRFFCIAGLAALFVVYDKTLLRNWWRLLAIPATVVIGFGLLQILVLPHTFLEHFGYGPDTIPAFQTIDNKVAFHRVQSTLRGANPLGAYLLVVLAAAVVRIKQSRTDWLAVGLIVGGLPVLFFTYSRSAWIGLGLTLVTLAGLYGRRFITKRRMIAVCLLVMLGIGGIWLLRDNDFVQNVVFHSDETSVSRSSSNDQRGNALSRAVGDIAEAPLGGGVGSAGPASFRNAPVDARISENYFLQSGQELGWLGVIGLVAVMLSAGRYLWRDRQTALAAVLFATLLGLTFINMVSHAWADDVLALLWWCLAGLVMGHGILNEERTHETKNAQRIKTPR